MNRRSLFSLLACCGLALVGVGVYVASKGPSTVVDAGEKPAAGPSWPMFGGTPARNMVNLTDKDLALEWSVSEGSHKNVKWVAELGTKAYGGPVVGGNRI